MRIDIANIPKEKFQKIQQGIIKTLLENGIKYFETTTIVDGTNNQFMGFDIEVTKE